MALLAGSIPLVALQTSALKVDDKVLLHFTLVLDQSTLRSDDVYELGERTAADTAETDRSWREQRSKPSILAILNELLRMAEETSGQPYRMRYRKKIIDLAAGRIPERGCAAGTAAGMRRVNVTRRNHHLPGYALAG